MLLFDIITTFFKSFNTSPQHSIPVSTSLISIYPDFDAYMQRTYPNVLTNKFTFLPIGRKYYNKSNCKYICLLCNDWFFGNKTHVNKHSTKIHFLHVSKSDLKQPSITSIFNTMNNTTSLHYSFNKQ